MFKGIFLCVLFAVLSANSMAHLRRSADARSDEIKKRDIQKISHSLGKALQHAMKGKFNQCASFPVLSLFAQVGPNVLYLTHKAFSG
ncbi:hypothetical protein XELAEV_18033212mg [Xenopus laevis]|uniref:Uncharacterized protein n=1 Tax=Xenopus laevis TaxID=8355 RepID=A0A974HDS7_XENLA|nr:hypothetical protein XELAEV_18033212mg [Xenopus laevis]